MSQSIYCNICPASSHPFSLPYDNKPKWIWANQPPNDRMWQSHMGHWLTFLKVPQEFDVKDTDVSTDYVASCHHCIEMAESLIYFCSVVQS